MISHDTSRQPPPLNEQLKIINSKDPTFFKLGDNEAYFISKHWYDNWHELALKYQSKSNTDNSNNGENEPEIKIPPIDNSDFLIQNGDSFKLNNMKKLDTDFICVNPETWKTLVDWYGGGPTFSGPTEKDPVFSSYSIPVTEFFNIFVSYLDQRKVVFETYKLISGSELHKRICKFFNIEKSDETILTYNGKVVNANKSIGRQFIHMNCELVLEPKNKNQKNYRILNSKIISSNTNLKSSQKPTAESENHIIPTSENLGNKNIVTKNIETKNAENKKIENTENLRVNNGLPSKQEQKRIINELNSKNHLIEGENGAYLLEKSWNFIWHRYISSVSDDDPIPPPIDNISLFKSDGTPNRARKEGIHFMVYTPDAYNQLVEWYGGGPPLPVRVYKIPGASANFPSKLVAGTSYIIIFVDYRDRTDAMFEVCEYTPLKELMDMSRDYYNVPESEETRLFYKGQVFTLHRTIGQSPLSSKCHIILDYKTYDEPQDNSSSSNPPVNENNPGSHINTQPNTNTSSNNNNNNDTIGKIGKWNQVEHPTSRLASSDRPSTNFSANSTSYNNSGRTALPSLMNYSNNSSHYSHSYYDRNPMGPGMCGLQNIGNTCFFNSGVQCLVHTRLLVKYLLSGQWRNELNPTNPIGMHGKLAQAFVDVTERIWSGSLNSFSPQELKDVIGEFAPQFSGYGQQDSHELITFMLDGIHEDLNRVVEKPVVDGINGDGTNDEEIAIESWSRYKKRNDSIIVDLFHAQLKSTLVCPQCHEVTIVFDPYMSLQLPIARPRQLTINVVFVPIDPKQEHAHIKVPLKENHSISHQISKIIGRVVNVAMLYEVNNIGSKPSYQWCINDHYHSDRIYFALEVPNNSNCLYIPCTITAELKSTSSFSFFFGSSSSSSKEYTSACPPALIPVSSFSLTKKDLTEIINNYYDYFWDPETVNKELTQNQNDFIDKLEIHENGTYNPDKRLTIDQLMQLESHTAFPNISSQVVSIIINPNAMSKNPDCNFSFYNFLKDCDDFKFRASPALTKQMTLDKCFKYFSINETLDENNKWYCPHCKEFVRADKKLDIWSVPEVLVIQLKRFIRNEEHFLRKLNTKVEYPSKLAMSKYLVGPQKNEKIEYRLYAVSEHMGGLCGGHYTAHTRVSDRNLNVDKSKWYSFNDSYVGESSENRAHNDDAYVLFYERIDTNNQNQ
ncbi:hypothetical protein TRFO_41622 [Tritrichomonas foetus]|uniref:ubiquitinyl hydrolase 1 n=1 Tax=Tritrichomonas foetus TaxID=1144522 RepID=A0A1J4L412_9EUKA|nr:hypothetical protein TRFO_41622 [Tritrichomonas foetus]|eukprot:OHT16694.1 hypothetical protein TRFO_41622 [Tritrichomonas foetus]